MTLYHVTWAIDIEADSPREAAEKARYYQTKPDTIATVFDVFAPMHEPPKAGGPRHRVATVDLSQRSSGEIVECVDCGESWDLDDLEIETTHQQWHCPCCGSWHDRNTT